MRDEDREDVRRYIEELLSRGQSPGRIDKVLTTLVVIGRKLSIPIKESGLDDVRRYVAWLEGTNEYRVPFAGKIDAT